jgi:hypothetical protein
LVLRLASLLWRLRRSTAIETGLYKIQTERMRKQNYQVYLALRGSSERYGQASPEPDYTGPPPWFAFDKAATADVATDLSHCFLRLSNIPNSVLDRLGLYRKRNCIERVIGHLKINRAIATRYDQLADSFLGMLYVATARYWIKFVVVSQ